MKNRRDSSQIAVRNLRTKINRLDSRLVALLDDRAKAAIDMAVLKKKSKAGFYAPDREQEVHARTKRLSRGVFPLKALRAVYREIMSGCLGLEDNFHIIHPGSASGSAGKAARSRFGTSLKYKSSPSQSSLIKQVQSGQAGYGILELENSKRGLNGAALVLLLRAKVKICAEILFPEPSLSCLPHTRFVVVGKSDPRPTGYDRTSLILQISTSPGSLERVIDLLESSKIQVSHVETRAKLGRPGCVGLFLELFGHHEDDNTKKGLGKLSRMSKGLRILGSYPRQTW